MRRMINFLAIIEVTTKRHLLENGYRKSKCSWITTKIILLFFCLKIEETVKRGDQKILTMIAAPSMSHLLNEQK
jgi:hypothetical protein